jgi:hypothetical protein
MYVYLLPVAREFNGRPDAADASRSETPDELEKLVAYLAERYADSSNVLFGLGAEPEGEDFNSWHWIQVSLAEIVRRHSESPVLVTGFRYVNGLLPYSDAQFPDSNVIYLGGGYVGKDDEEVSKRPDLLAQQVPAVRMEEFSEKRPYIAGEFGGNYGGDFSSPNDLAIIRAMLLGMNGAGTNYTMYRLSSNFENDGLALFDLTGNVTKRGAVFFDALRESPPTQF